MTTVLLAAWLLAGLVALAVVDVRLLRLLGLALAAVALWPGLVILFSWRAIKRSDAKLTGGIEVDRGGE